MPDGDLVVKDEDTTKSLSKLAKMITTWNFAPNQTLGVWRNHFCDLHDVDDLILRRIIQAQRGVGGEKGLDICCGGWTPSMVGLDTG